MRTRGGLTEARLRMARVPEGAELIANRVSGAPGIRIGNIFIMAGVPHITAGMLDGLTGTLEGGRPVVSLTVGGFVPESEVADLLRDDRARARRACRSAATPSSAKGASDPTSSCARKMKRWRRRASTSLARGSPTAGYEVVAGGI